jgi:hypothetical protein
MQAAGLQKGRRVNSQQEAILSAYLKQLYETVEADHATHEAAQAEKQRATADEAREKLAPLEKRLARLLATIPTDVQAEGLSLMSLQAQLRARGRGHSRCHVGELGLALSRLGWRRVRNWSKSEGGFCAKWFPPSGKV